MEILNFRKNLKPRKDSQGKNTRRINTLESLYKLFEGRERVLDAFRSEIFPLAPTEGTGCPSHLACIDHIAKVSDQTPPKILTPKQMLQKAIGNSSCTSKSR